MKSLLLAIAIFTSPPSGYAGFQEWTTETSPDGQLVTADFTEDDGSKLLIACRKLDKQIGYLFVEKRAQYQKGSQIELKIRADGGGHESSPVAESRLNLETVYVGAGSTIDLYAMSKGTIWFAVGDGEHAHLFLIKGFKEATEPVLRACGDHWSSQSHHPTRA